MPIVHTINRLYKELYQIGKNAPKRDKHGIQQKIEHSCLDCLRLAIVAVFLPPGQKETILQKLRIEIEVLKQLVRLSNDLEIIGRKKYFLLEQQLIEISKMCNGWIKYINSKTKEAQ